MAFLAVRILSRRKLLRFFQIPGLILIPLVMFLPPRATWTCPPSGIFVLGFVTVAQFSFWGNYLPLVYPTYLRGTGESFAANIGGRMLGTSAAPARNSDGRISCPEARPPATGLCRRNRRTGIPHRIHGELLAARTFARDHARLTREKVF